MIVANEYGRGVECLRYVEGKTGYGHDGDLLGFNSFIYNEGDVTLVLLVNGAGYSMSSAAWTTLSAVYGNDFGIPNLNTIRLDNFQLEKFVGVFKGVIPPLQSDSSELHIINDGKKLVMQLSPEVSPFKVEPRADGVFIDPALDVEMSYNSSCDSIKMRVGGDNLVFVKKK